MANASRVRLLNVQSRIIEAIDERYDVSTINIDLIKISLPLQPSSWKQLSVDAAEKLLDDPKAVDSFLKELEEQQIKKLLDLLGFVNNPLIGTGEMAIRAKGYRRAGSDIVVKLLIRQQNGRSTGVFDFAVAMKGSLRLTANTAEELLDALGKMG